MSELENNETKTQIWQSKSNQLITNSWKGLKNLSRNVTGNPKCQLEVTEDNELVVYAILGESYEKQYIGQLICS